MGDYDDTRTGWHRTFLLHAHLVFVTRYRHKVFADRHLQRMKEIMRAVCADFETEPVEFNGKANHVHRCPAGESVDAPSWQRCLGREGRRD